MYIFYPAPIFRFKTLGAKLGDDGSSQNFLLRRFFCGLFNYIIIMLSDIPSNDRMAGQLNCKECGNKSM